MARLNGMPGNANNVMKQLRKVQKQMEEQVEAFESKEFEATTGGDVTRIMVINGREVSKTTLDRNIAGPDDVETLEDFIKAAINETLHMAGAENQQVVDKLTGGLSS